MVILLHYKIQYRLTPHSTQQTWVVRTSCVNSWTTVQAVSPCTTGCVCTPGRCSWALFSACLDTDSL